MFVLAWRQLGLVGLFCFGTFGFLTSGITKLVSYLPGDAGNHRMQKTFLGIKRHRWRREVERQAEEWKREKKTRFSWHHLSTWSQTYPYTFQENEPVYPLYFYLSHWEWFSVSSNVKSPEPAGGEDLEANQFQCSLAGGQLCSKIKSASSQTPTPSTGSLGALSFKPPRGLIHWRETMRKLAEF